MEKGKKGKIENHNHAIIQVCVFGRCWHDRITSVSNMCRWESLVEYKKGGTAFCVGCIYFISFLAVSDVIYYTLIGSVAPLCDSHI
jgi:hypothetical protein